MNLSICSYNVRGLGNKTKREQIFAWIKTNNISVCLLQETHSGDGTHDIWKREWNNDAFFSGHNNNSEGIGILIYPNFSYTIQNYSNIIDGRLQALDLIVNNKELTIINIYGPNNDNSAFYKQLEEYMQENEEKTFIIGGDFNTVLNEAIDKRNGRTETHKSRRKQIKDIMESFNLIDIWREMHPNTKEYTWHSSHKPPIFSRLDCFLISENLKNLIVTCKHNISYKSDHSPVCLNIDVINLTRGPGYFKLNNSLLLDTEYQETIKKSINEIALINEGSNPNTLWELIKGTVRNETIKYETKKKKDSNRRENVLIEDIDQLTKSLTETNEATQAETFGNILEEKRSELETLRDIKLNGLILRSKANIVEQSERNTKYFASLEKKRSEGKVILRLLINNEINTNQTEILSETESYYKKLYSKRDTQNSRLNFFDDSIDKLKRNR